MTGPPTGAGCDDASRTSVSKSAVDLSSTTLDVELVLSWRCDSTEGAPHALRANITEWCANVRQPPARTRRCMLKRPPAAMSDPG
eukprot:scaffold189_cov118-Isochrysis_galbana.AAC.9